MSTTTIPLRFRDQIASMPECKYGVNRIKVTLDDGTMYSDVYVGWCEEIVKVGNSEKVPFDATRIIKVDIN